MTVERRWASIAAIIGALAAGPGSAAPGPALDWRTIETDWCNVHFHTEAETPGRRVAALCDESVMIAAAFFGAPPLERIEVVVADTDDRANGFTRTVPYNLVILYAVSPSGRSELAHTEDHLKLVLLHEIVHIVHLDVMSGIPLWANRVVGKFWPPNLIQPRWVVEGIAVWVESHHTEGGRLRTDRFSSELRVAALAGDLWELDDLSNYSRRPPAGNAAYVYGSHFIAWLISREGADIVARLAHQYGGQTIPFGLQRSFSAVSDVDLERAYDQWRGEVLEDARQVQAAIAQRGGPPPTRRLTRMALSASSVCFDAEGTMVFSGSTPAGERAVFELRGLPEETRRPIALLRAQSTSGVAVLPDGRYVVAQVERDLRRLPFHDLFVWSEGRALHRLTTGRRLQRPVAMPDGHHVVAERRTGTVSEVVLVNVDTAREQVLVTYRDGTQIFGPVPSPDGTKVAYERASIGGGRDLWEIDVATRTQRALTDAASDDGDPSYTRDGHRLLFTSNRGGSVYNAWALDRRTGETWRLTDTTGSVTAPVSTPDGRAFVYSDLTVDGGDLFVAALDLPPAEPADVAPASRRDVDEEGAVLPAGPEPRAARLSEAPSSIYNPLPSLLPRTWAPTLSLGAFSTGRLGLQLGGSDAVELFNWSLTGGWDPVIRAPDLTAVVRLNAGIVPVGVRAEYSVAESPISIGDGELQEVQLLRQAIFRGSVEARLPLSFWARSHSLTVGYSRTFYVDDHEVLLGTPDGPAPRRPPPGNIGSVVVTYSYSDGDAYRDSISTEEGESITLRWRASNAFTFSELDLYETTVDVRVFRQVPMLPRHVVAVYLSGGFATGERRRRATFRLGGIADRNFATDLVSQSRFGAGQLRGYPALTDVGDGFGLASIEYRFPLWEVERGIGGPLPLALSRIWGVAFTDIGDAFVDFPRADRVKTSVGVEARVQLLVSYYGSFMVRVGYARGLNPRGVHQPYVVLGAPY